MKPYIVFFLIAPVFKAIEASAELLQPKIMTTTVNAGIIASDASVMSSGEMGYLCWVWRLSGLLAVSGHVGLPPSRRRGSALICAARSFRRFSASPFPTSTGSPQVRSSLG